MTTAGSPIAADPFLGEGRQRIPDRAFTIQEVMGRGRQEWRN